MVELIEVEWPAASQRTLSWLYLLRQGQRDLWARGGAAASEKIPSKLASLNYEDVRLGHEQTLRHVRVMSHQSGHSAAH